jgi:hypothetical protein
MSIDIINTVSAQIEMKLQKQQQQIDRLSTAIERLSVLATAATLGKKGK